MAWCFHWFEPWLCVLSPAGWLPRVRDQLRPLMLNYDYGKPLPFTLWKTFGNTETNSSSCSSSSSTAAAVLCMLFGRNWIVACICLKWSTASSTSLASLRYSMLYRLRGASTWLSGFVASVITSLLRNNLQGSNVSENQKDNLVLFRMLFNVISDLLQVHR